MKANIKISQFSRFLLRSEYAIQVKIWKLLKLLNSVPFIKKPLVNQVCIWIWSFWLTFTVLQWMKKNSKNSQFSSFLLRTGYAIKVKIWKLLKLLNSYPFIKKRLVNHVYIRIWSSSLTFTVLQGMKANIKISQFSRFLLCSEYAIQVKIWKWLKLLNSVPFIKKPFVNQVCIWIWSFWLTFTVLQWMKKNSKNSQFSSFLLKSGYGILVKIWKWLKLLNSVPFNKKRVLNHVYIQIWSSWLTFTFSQGIKANIKISQFSRFLLRSEYPIQVKIWKCIKLLNSVPFIKKLLANQVCIRIWSFWLTFTVLHWMKRNSENSQFSSFLLWSGYAIYVKIWKWIKLLNSYPFTKKRLVNHVYIRIWSSSLTFTVSQGMKANIKIRQFSRFLLRSEYAIQVKIEKWPKILYSVPFIKKPLVNQVCIWIWSFWLTFTVLQWMKKNSKNSQFSCFLLRSGYAILVKIWKWLKLLNSDPFIKKRLLNHVYIRIWSSSLTFTVSQGMKANIKISQFSRFLLRSEYAIQVKIWKWLKLLNSVPFIKKPLVSQVCNLIWSFWLTFTVLQWMKKNPKNSQFSSFLLRSGYAILVKIWKSLKLLNSVKFIKKRLLNHVYIRIWSSWLTFTVSQGMNANKFYSEWRKTPKIVNFQVSAKVRVCDFGQNLKITKTS